MKRNNKILKYYFITLIIMLCFFTLGFGTVSAKNNTQRSAKGTNQTRVTDETINEYLSSITF